MIKDSSGDEPDGLMKLKNRSGRYQHVTTTDPMIRPHELDGIHKLGDDDDLHNRFTSKPNSDIYNDRFPMDVSSSSSISRNETRHSIHWSHVYEQIKSMFRIAVPYFCESKQSRWLVAGLFFFMLLDNGTTVIYSYVNRDFWNALAEQNAAKFYTNLVYYIATLLIMAPIDAMYIYYQSQFALHWRAWLTTRTIQLYTSNQVYYNIEIGRGKEVQTDDPRDTGMGSIVNRRLIDNPDQRITEDVEAFTKLSIDLCFEMFGTFIQLFSFCAILWSIYPQLLWIAFVYSFAGTVITTWLGHPLIQLNVEHLRREADLRYSLVRFRENAEAIAFYLYAAFLEQNALASRLKHVVTNQYRINLITRTMYLFTFSYNLTRAFLPVVIMAPQFFDGKIEMGIINQSSGAFAMVVTSLSTIVNGFDTISVYAANIERLSRFYEAMANADECKRKHWSPSERKRHILRVAMNTEGTSPPETIATNNFHKDTLLGEYGKDVELQEMENVKQTHLNGNGCITIIANGHTDGCFNKNGSSNCFSGVGTIDLQRKLIEGNVVLQIECLDLITPNLSRRLIHDLSVTVTSGQHLLIVGASGVGKSSLLRAIAGLWKTGHGRIMRPADEDVYFLPQQPYCTLGSLRDQLLYPTLTQQQRSSDPVDDITDWSFRSVECVPTDMNHSFSSRPLQPNITDEDLIRILEQINLLEIATRAGDGNPIQGLNVVMDWSHVLSLGERQRLAFGRLLVHRPKRLVVLDEATSALDLYNEKCMYQLLQGLATNTASAMTYISVGHRPTLAEFHVMRLNLGETVGDTAAEYILSSI